MFSGVCVDGNYFPRHDMIVMVIRSHEKDG